MKFSEFDDDSGDEFSAFSNGGITFGLSEVASVRPGFVHRLDKGTSGLLVVAKDEHSHSHLAEQFKEHTVKRVYVSLTCGVPSSVSGCIDVPIGRDPNSRACMVALPVSGAQGKTRHAVSSANVTSHVCNKASFHSNCLVPIPDFSDSYNPSLNEKRNYSGLQIGETMNAKFPRLDCFMSHNINEIYGAGAHSSICSVLQHALSRNSTTPLYQVRQAHAQVLRTGLFDLPHYSSKLISLYVNQHCFLDAKNLLRSLMKPNLHLFTTLINSYSKQSDFKNTLGLFSQMLSNGLFPDAYVLPGVIKACTGLSAVNVGKQVHGFSIASTLSRDPFVESSLIHFYVKCDELIGAQK